MSNVGGSSPVRFFIIGQKSFSHLLQIEIHKIIYLKSLLFTIFYKNLHLLFLLCYDVSKQSKNGDSAKILS